MLEPATRATANRCARWAPAPGVLFSAHGDVGYLLEPRRECYLGLNETATLMWRDLAQGIPPIRIASAIADVLEVSEACARSDVQRFIEELAERRLIVPRGHEQHSGSTEPCVSGAPTPERDDFAVPSWIALVTSLLVATVFLRLAGLRRTLRACESTTTSAVLAVSEEHRLILTRRMRTVAGWLPMRAACLEQSVALVWLLRRRGVEATLRLGTRAFPFSAHAWVESGGRPVNEAPDELLRYQLLR